MYYVYYIRLLNENHDENCLNFYTHLFVCIACLKKTVPIGVKCIKCVRIDRYISYTYTLKVGDIYFKIYINSIKRIVIPI